MSIGDYAVIEESLKPRFISRRYLRENRHVIRNILLLAIITGMLAGFGTYFISNSTKILQRHEPLPILETIGRQSISLDAMKQIVHKNNLVVYWLGGDSNSVFSLDYMDSAAPVLANMTLMTTGELWGVKIVSIQTYLSNAAYKANLLGRIHQVADTVLVDSRGDNFMTNPLLPTQMIVDIAQTDRVVVLTYLVPQTIRTMTADAEKLKLIQ
jgi:hypothetical protein